MGKGTTDERGPVVTGREVGKEVVVVTIGPSSLELVEGVGRTDGRRVVVIDEVGFGPNMSVGNKSVGHKFIVVVVWHLVSVTVTVTVQSLPL